MMFDREKAREVLRDNDVWIGDPLHMNEKLLDALAGCVSDEPQDACQHMTKCADSACKYRIAAAEPQTIDRAALILEIEALVGFAVMSVEVEALADRVLALLRPDPRIVKLEAELDTAEDLYQHQWSTTSAEQNLDISRLRAILRGES